MSHTQHARQVLLDLLAEYREMDTPANPDLLKLHIDTATDRLDTIYATSNNKLIQSIEDKLPKSKEPKAPYDILELEKAFQNGRTQALTEVKSILESMKENT